MEAAEWDAKYAERDLVWSAGPNVFVERYAADLPVGRALDEVIDRGIPVVMGIGEHSNDRMVSFYPVTPSGFLIEYGCNGRIVGDDWTVGRYTAISNWGHRMPDGSHSPGVPVWQAMA